MKEKYERIVHSKEKKENPLPTERQYFLDWLRVIVVALLVPHHAAITFSHLGDAYVYAPTADTSVYYFFQSAFLNLWFMRLLFFVSGFSGYYALQKRSPKEYLAERGKRLILPLFFGVVVLCPLTAYFLGINSYGFRGNFFRFYPVFFKNFDTYLGWGHFWFLAYLFVFSLILLGIRTLRKPKGVGDAGPKEKSAKPVSVFLPVFLVIMLEMVFRPFFPGHQNLYADWANFTVYLFFFLAGYRMAGEKAWLQRISEKLPAFSVLSLLSAAVFLFLKYAEAYRPEFQGWLRENLYFFQVLRSGVQGAAEYFLVMFFTGLAKKYFNFSNPLLAYLSKTSFSLYTFHYLVLSGVMFFLLPCPAGSFPLYAAGTGLTYLIVFFLFETLIKRLPPLRFLCGIKKERS